MEKEKKKGIQSFWILLREEGINYHPIDYSGYMYYNNIISANAAA